MKEIKVNLVEKPQIILVDGKHYKVTIEPLKKDTCICGCGKPRATKNSKYAFPACRMRVYRSKQVIDE